MSIESSYKKLEKTIERRRRLPRPAHGSKTEQVEELVKEETNRKAKRKVLG